MGNKTKKPKGAKITRNGSNVYAEWECASENYNGGQELQLLRWVEEPRRVNGSVVMLPIHKWIYIDISNGTRKKKITTVSGWINGRCQKIRIRGKRAPYTTGSGRNAKTHTPDWSDWVEVSFSFGIPNIPSVSLAQGVSDASCTMSWSVSGVDNTNNKPFSNIEYQTMIIENQSSKSFPESLWKSSQIGWGTGTRSSSSGSLSINNNVTFTSTNSLTRVVRARAVGPAGTSGWSTPAYYTYATPKKVSISSGTATGTSSYTCDVKWSSPATFAYPIDYFHPMYLMGTPTNTGMGVPAGADWSEAGPNQANHQKAYPFALSSVLGYDEALWFRIDSLHGTRTQYGNECFVRFGGVKPITAADIYIEYDSETQVLTVGETYSSDLPSPSVKVDIPYYNNNGQMLKTVTQKIDGEIEINNYVLPTNVSTVTFKARVEWGSYYTNYISKEFYPKTAASPYAYCPTAINVSNGSAVGSVRLSWDVPLGDATGAEVGYSTNQVNWTTEDAINDDSTIITGIDYDVDYWYRVRLKSSRGETKWSNSVRFKLSTSSLLKPTSLAVVRGDMKDNLKVTWDWSDFSNANGIEISWADNENAWDSSESPSSAQISRTESNGVFYINGLERDTTWYVRARFMAAGAFSGAITKSCELPLIPIAPSNVVFERTSKLNTPRISWEWSWDDAESAEVTWADDVGAWTTTSGPESATIEDRTRDYLDITDLETGKMWYAKVRLIYGGYSSESDIVSVDLRTAPETPRVTLSDASIPATLGKTDISWSYVCEDGLPQQSASVWIVDDEGEFVRQIASVNDTSNAVTIYADTSGLVGDTDYMITVQVVSTSGLKSAWSSPVTLSVSLLPEAHITQTSLEEVTLTDGEGGEYTVTALTRLPLTLSVTGAGDKGTITAYVERTHSYFVEQPNEKPAKGYEGEIVLLGRRDSDGLFSFDVDDMRGSLDDGGRYRLVAIIKDSMGQTDEDYVDFEIVWEHKAFMPEATVVTEDGVVKITPIAPQGVWEGDYCEIYRLSADTPQLIVPRAQFGATYIDPFPTLGKFGGHRIVYRTTTGDFITEDKIIAIRDYETADDAEFPEVGIMGKKTIIDFGTGRVELDRNLDVNNKWEKDFVETSYLGGSIQGDWNPAVRRSGSSSTCSITLVDEDTIKDMRRLAAYTGECHVRTPDGSSYAANVQVSENWSHSKGFFIAEYTLDITRVDGDRYDGVLVDELEIDND